VGNSDQPDERYHSNGNVTTSGSTTGNRKYFRARRKAVPISAGAWWRIENNGARVAQLEPNTGVGGSTPSSSFACSRGNVMRTRQRILRILGTSVNLYTRSMAMARNAATAARDVLADAWQMLSGVATARFIC